MTQVIIVEVVINHLNVHGMIYLLSSSPPPPSPLRRAVIYGSLCLVGGLYELRTAPS